MIIPGSVSLAEVAIVASLLLQAGAVFRSAVRLEKTVEVIKQAVEDLQVVVKEVGEQLGEHSTRIAVLEAARPAVRKKAKVP